MRRWGGMLEEGEKPVPNKNIRLVIEWLDRYAEALPPLTVIGGCDSGTGDCARWSAAEVSPR